MVLVSLRIIPGSDVVTTTGTTRESLVTSLFLFVYTFNVYTARNYGMRQVRNTLSFIYREKSSQRMCGGGLGSIESQLVSIR